ncbi:MAG: hypothetical protein R2839_02400 [Thermomicrobiales bacterium]
MPTSSPWPKGDGGDAGVQVAFLRNGKLLHRVGILSHAGSHRGRSAKSSVGSSTVHADAAMVHRFSISAACAARRMVSAVIADWLQQRRNARVDMIVPQRRNRSLVQMVAKSAVDNLEQNRISSLSDLK